MNAPAGKGSQGRVTGCRNTDQTSRPLKTLKDIGFVGIGAGGIIVAIDSLKEEAIKWLKKGVNDLQNFMDITEEDLKDE